MPKRRTRQIRELRTQLGDRELMQFALHQGPFATMSDAALEAIYWANREAALAVGNWGALLCWPFWRYEPGIPEELREDPAELSYDYMRARGPRPGISPLEEQVAAYSAHRERRAGWLAAHPPE